MNLERRGRNSKRNSTACEHCRAARIRCQPSDQPGVCEKCLALKRECISRTRARPRRWEHTWGMGEIDPSLHPLGQLSTFSIDYSVPVKAGLDDNFETLREIHDRALNAALIEENPIDNSQTASQSVSLPSPSSLSNQPHLISDIWRQPLFNIASAESLLNSFKSMVNYLPFVILPDDSSVLHLAATKPFTLLSILTVASGSKMVQKHALYDDEFRKALGLKYVSGGERSLEMLQGLLIYCAWYPFHLWPKNGQLVHCLRMAADLVQDLHLDENFLTMRDPWSPKVTGDELEKIRAYLAYVYLVSTYIVVWKGETILRTHFPPWASSAIDTLQHNAQVESDNTLVALVRLSNLFSDASEAINERDVQTVQNSRLILIGLEQQYQEMQGSMTPTVLGSAKTYLSANITPFPPLLSKICTATKKLRAFLDYISDLEDSSLLSFTINDWTRLIVVLTLSFRLSFPLLLCPDFDSAWARSELQLDQFLSKVSHGADIATASNDIISARRAVLSVMKSKYDHRLGSLSEPPCTAPASRIFGCPMMDGSLRTSLGQWDPELINISGSSTDASEAKNLPLFNDVWASMTMGWGNTSDMSWDTFEDSF
ncbi:hypothetical protein V499_02026 [Pseudogymnoascus sp. VKM F-103]|nr:hypothetical protein V499_02026 [Pseudogymnoascus sp. VKM F-103]